MFLFIIGYNLRLFFIFNFVLIMFFSLDRKEPKDQDYQKKSENSTAHFTEILKLAPSTQWSIILSTVLYLLSTGDSDMQNFSRSAHRKFN